MGFVWGRVRLIPDKAAVPKSEGRVKHELTDFRAWRDASGLVGRTLFRRVFMVKKGWFVGDGPSKSQLLLVRARDSISKIRYHLCGRARRKS